MDGLADLVKPT